MADDKKTKERETNVTSGESIHIASYQILDTYENEATEESNLNQLAISTRYGGFEHNMKVSTHETRRHEKVREINKRLRKLGETA